MPAANDEPGDEPARSGGGEWGGQHRGPARGPRLCAALVRVLRALNARLGEERGRVLRGDAVATRLYYELLRLGAYLSRAARSRRPVDMLAALLHCVEGYSAREAVEAVACAARRLGYPPPRRPSGCPEPEPWEALGLTRFLYGKLLEYYPRSLLEALARPPGYVGVQVLAGSVEDAARLLEATGGRIEAGRVPGWLRVAGARGLHKLLHPCRLIAVDEPSSYAAQLAAAYATKRRLVDLCAAPGTKTLIAASRGVEVYAGDISAERLQHLARAATCHPGRVHVAQWDAANPPLASAPVALLDAPCSSTGVLARRPDAGLRVTPRELRRLTRIQAMLLRGAAKVLEPGGVLVYVTCSLLPEEGEELVEEHAVELGLEPVPASEWPLPCPYTLTRPWACRSLPHVHGVSGFFIAVLRRPP